MAQGAIATAQGIGAALSTSVAGAVVVGWGYGPAFITLGVAAGMALALLLIFMPEPSKIGGGKRPSTSVLTSSG